MSRKEVNRGVVPAPGPLRPFEFPTINHVSLSNGLPVLHARTDRIPVVTYSLLLPAGALRERREDAGLATLVGSLLESGTQTMDAAETAERLETLGVRVRVGTSWEASHVDFTVLAEKAAPAAELVAELIRQPAFPESEVERIRQEQVAGIVQRRAEPRGLANEMVGRFIYSDASPFSRPLAGTTTSVQGLGRDSAALFHARNFSPAAGTLVVAGSPDIEEVRTTAEAAFGEWKGGEASRVEPEVSPRFESAHVVIVERPGAVQSEIRIGHIGVPRNTPDYFPLRVMNTILGGAFSSRLNLNLREKHGFTYGVSSSFVMRRQPGPFVVSTAVQTEVTGRAVAEILSELTGIREGDVTPAELSDARQYVAGTFPLRLQTTDGVASRLAELAIYDLPDSYLDDFAERVLAVTAEDVAQAAREHIHPERLTVLVVGDPTSVGSQLESLAIGPVTSISSEATE